MRLTNAFFPKVVVPKALAMFHNKMANTAITHWEIAACDFGAGTINEVRPQDFLPRPFEASANAEPNAP
jgi:hypothetical protein